MRINHTTDAGNSTANPNDSARGTADQGNLSKGLENGGSAQKASIGSTVAVRWGISPNWPEKAPIGPEKAPISPEKPDSPGGFLPDFLTTLGV